MPTIEVAHRGERRISSSWGSCHAGRYAAPASRNYQLNPDPAGDAGQTPSSPHWQLLSNGHGGSDTDSSVRMKAWISQPMQCFAWAILIIWRTPNSIQRGTMNVANMVLNSSPAGNEADPSRLYWQHNSVDSTTIARPKPVRLVHESQGVPARPQRVIYVSEHKHPSLQHCPRAGER